MNRFGTYLPHQGADARPILPREPAQAHPGDATTAPLTWPRLYANALNSSAQNNGQQQASISDYSLESPEDILQDTQSTQALPYHKRHLTLTDLLEGLESFYNEQGLPGTMLKQHMETAESLTKYLEPEASLNRETRMSLCATAHRVMNMLSDQQAEAPDADTLERFINQSCLITINTDSPNSLLSPLANYFSARATAEKEQRALHYQAARNAQDNLILNQLTPENNASQQENGQEGTINDNTKSDAQRHKDDNNNHNNGHDQNKRRQIFPRPQPSEMHATVRNLKALQTSPISQGTWLSNSANTVASMALAIKKRINRLGTTLSHNKSAPHRLQQIGLDSNHLEAMRATRLSNKLVEQQLAMLTQKQEKLETLLSALQAAQNKLNPEETPQVTPTLPPDFQSITGIEQGNLGPWITTLRADANTLWLPALIAHQLDTDSGLQSQVQVQQLHNPISDNEWLTRVSRFAIAEIDFFQGNGPHSTQDQPSQASAESETLTLENIASQLKACLSQLTREAPQYSNGQAAEQNMAQLLNVLAFLHTMSNKLPNNRDAYLVKAYIPVIEGAIVRLQFFITSEEYTQQQGDIYRDLGDQRTTNGALSATLPTPLPILVSGALSACDNRDETASVNRLTQSSANISLGGKMGPLQLSGGFTGTRMHWYIYNTVKDFALALAEQDITKHLKKRLSNTASFKQHPEWGVPSLLQSFSQPLPRQPTTKSTDNNNRQRPFQDPLGYLQQCRMQKQDHWSKHLERTLLALDPATRSHPGDYLVKHTQPTDSNYMELTQHFLGIGANVATLSGGVNRSNDSNYVYTPYYELFENNSNLLDDSDYIFSEKISNIWEPIRKELADHNLTSAFASLEHAIATDAQPAQKLETLNESEPLLPHTQLGDESLPQFDFLTRFQLKNIVFSAAVRLKHLTDRAQNQYQSPSNTADKQKQVNQWRQLQAECARLKRLYNHIIKTEAHTPTQLYLDPHLMYFDDLEKYIMQPTFDMVPQDYTTAFFATEIAHGHTTNYFNTSFDLPLAIPNTALTVTPSFSVNRYGIENCGIPNLDGQYCDFSFTLKGALSSAQLSEAITRCSQQVIQQLTHLPHPHPHRGMSDSITEQIQSAFSQMLSLDLSANTGLRVFWRFNQTQTDSWEMQYRVISSQIAAELDAQSPTGPFDYLSPVSASVSNLREKGRMITLGDNTMKHIYRRFHSPFGFNKFWAWWQFLVDFRKQVSPMLQKLNQTDSTIRKELDLLCDAIREGISKKGHQCTVTESMLDNRIDALQNELNRFCVDASTANYQNATLALTNLLALDFDVLYFDKLLDSYTLHLPKDAQSANIIRP